MTIPNNQLETWANHGAEKTAADTYNSICTALTSLQAKPEIYLQGSYKNTTNIRGDSDVDVVAQLNRTFQYDLTALPEPEKVLYKAAYPDATYTFDNFRNDVQQTLQTYYGAGNIKVGDKAIKISAAPGRLPSDVVPCLQYRRYFRFRSVTDEQYVEGIALYSKNSNRWVFNYPKVHYANGVDKNSSVKTKGWFKPTVRMYKNMRTYLVDRKVLDNAAAPSYFIECLIYNVPDAQFGVDYATTFYNSIKWLLSADLDKFLWLF